MFISVEGIEGCGKSTLVKGLGQYFQERKIEHVITKEPGSTSIGKTLRSILLDKKQQISPLTELLLMFSDRLDHLDKVVKPSLGDGKIVITDRYIDSTYAYQGAGRGVSKNIIDDLVSKTEIMLPDRTILLDLDPEVGLKRASSRNELDRFESENLEFHKRLRKSFLDAAGADPDRFLTVDAEQEPDDILQSVINKLF
jgi:dTMP kinase